MGDRGDVEDKAGQALGEADWLGLIGPMRASSAAPMIRAGSGVSGRGCVLMYTPRLMGAEPLEKPGLCVVKLDRAMEEFHRIGRAGEHIVFDGNHRGEGRRPAAQQAPGPAGLGRRVAGKNNVLAAKRGGPPVEQVGNDEARSPGCQEGLHFGQLSVRLQNDGIIAVQRQRIAGIAGRYVDKQDIGQRRQGTMIEPTPRREMICQAHAIYWPQDRRPRQDSESIKCAPERATIAAVSEFLSSGGVAAFDG